MEQHDWQRIKSIVNSALALDLNKRAEFVDSECAGNDELKAQVDELLFSYDTDFLESNGSNPPLSNTNVLIPGERIGRYEIVRLLGVGGMGEVYLARDASLDRLVCIKVFPSSPSIDRNFLERFVREAQMASALNHPHICTIYEINREHDPPFIAMEYIEGRTLSEMIASGELEPRTVVNIALQIADGLADAHGAGIVHRDIKPANIIVNRRGDAKILDFGLAKRITTDLDEKTQAKLSVSGTIMGTVSYMSPEQIKGEKIDGRSDVFSLGVLLYEMTTGRRPFDGNSTAETMALILTTEPLSLSTGSRAEIQALIRKCLEKDKTGRYQSMSDVVSELKRISEGNADEPNLHNETTLAFPKSNGQEAVVVVTRGRHSKSLNRPYLGTALAMLTILAAGLGIWYLVGARPAAVAINSLAVMPFVNETGNPDSEYLSDGITESLIGRLSQLPGLSVKARSTVFRFKGKDIAPKEIGKELSVPAILTGRLSRRENEYKLYIELVDAATEKVVWQAEYNRPESSFAVIPGEIARDVANTLRQKLSGVEEQKITRSYTENSAAYELYLKGRYYWDKRNEESYNVAEDAYKQAIALDPNYALAYAGLADCFLFSEARGIGRRESIPLAKQYALKALSIDENLAEAHTTLAFVNENFDFDAPAAESGFKRAIELKPNYAVAHQFYGGFLVQTGHTEEGLAEARRAVELEPYSVAMNWYLGMLLEFARRYDEAIAQQKKTLQMQSDYPLAESNLAGIYVLTGKYADAAALIQKGLRAEEQGDRSLEAIVHLRTGLQSDTRKVLGEMIDRCNTQCGNTAYGIAKVYTALGEKDEAIQWLNIGYDRRVFNMFFLRVDPFFDGLHGDPRYEELLRRIGLQS